jgi:hypothetical protein
LAEALAQARAPFSRPTFRLPGKKYNTKFALSSPFPFGDWFLNGKAGELEPTPDFSEQLFRVLLIELWRARRSCPAILPEELNGAANLSLWYRHFFARLVMMAPHVTEDATRNPKTFEWFSIRLRVTISANEWSGSLRSLLFSITSVLITTRG